MIKISLYTTYKMVMFLNGMLVTYVKLRTRKGFYVTFILSHYIHGKMADFDMACLFEGPLIST